MFSVLFRSLRWTLSWLICFRKCVVSHRTDHCSGRRLAFILRGQVNRYGRKSQEAATKTHQDVVRNFQLAGFEVDVFLSYRSHEDLGQLKAYKDARHAVTNDSECSSFKSNTMRNCFQSRSMARALELIQASNISFAFVLIARFDMVFKIDLLQTPGLLQARFADCSRWSKMNHTYWGPWWQGRMMRGSKAFYGPNKQICDTLQLFPGHVVGCLLRFLKEGPDPLITHKVPDPFGGESNGFQRCDPDPRAMEGLMFPGWFDPGIKGQSNPLYWMPGRKAPGACRTLADFRWLQQPMLTYCCSKKGDNHECQGSEKCDEVCRLTLEQKRKYATKNRPPDWICCGNGSVQVMSPVKDMLPGLQASWWQEPLRRGRVRL